MKKHYFRLSRSQRIISRNRLAYNFSPRQEVINRVLAFSAAYFAVRKSTKQTIEIILN